MANSRQRRSGTSSGDPVAAISTLTAAANKSHVCEELRHIRHVAGHLRVRIRTDGIGASGVGTNKPGRTASRGRRDRRSLARRSVRGAGIAAARTYERRAALFDEYKNFVEQEGDVLIIVVNAYLVQATRRPHSQSIPLWLTARIALHEIRGRPTAQAMARGLSFLFGQFENDTRESAGLGLRHVGERIWTLVLAASDAVDATGALTSCGVQVRRKRLRALSRRTVARRPPARPVRSRRRHNDVPAVPSFDLSQASGLFARQ